VQQNLKVPQAELRACLWNFGTFDRSAIKRNARASHISRINLNEYTLGSNCRSKVCIRAKKIGWTLVVAVYEARTIKV
jgi:hypothetical protein